MELLKRTTVALAAVATLGVGTAKADLVFVGVGTIGGTGLGTVNTVLTIQSTANNTAEQGCVGGSGGAGDFIGPTAGATTSSNGGQCVSGTAPDVKTGASQTQTRTLSEAGITAGSNFAIVLNSAEPAGNGITVNTLSATFYNSAGTALYTAACNATCLAAVNAFSQVSTATGTGNSGFIFTLNAAEAAIVQNLINTNGGLGGIHVGIASSLGVPIEATGGNETFFIANSQAATLTPEPSTTALLATGLIGLVGFVRRRRA